MSYNKRCAVCQYMKRHRDFRDRVLTSSYISPEGTETIMDVVRYFQAPFTRDNMYTHFLRHEPELRRNAVVAEVESTVKVIEVGDKSHIDGLDEFIRQGREKLRRNELQITSTNFLTAIKIKSDDEKSNKDRKVDLLKTMFAGAGPTQVSDGPKSS